MSEQTPVTHALGELHVPYRVFQHPGPVESLEQAARERGQAPQQVIRSIVFRLAQDEYVMALMAGSDQISWGALRKYLGVSRVTTATPDELRQATGYEIGAVAPFGLPKPMRTLIDRSVLEPEEFSIGSGVRGTTVILKSSDLNRALPDAEVVTLK